MTPKFHAQFMIVSWMGGKYSRNWKERSQCSSNENSPIIVFIVYHNLIRENLCSPLHRTCPALHRTCPVFSHLILPSFFIQLLTLDLTFILHTRNFSRSQNMYKYDTSVYQLQYNVYSLSSYYSCGKNSLALEHKLDV